jgi:hypothetical protein
MILSRHIVISRERGRDFRLDVLGIRRPESFATFVDNSSPEADEFYAQLDTQ